MDAYLELIFDNYKQMTEENAKLREFRQMGINCENFGTFN